MNTHHRKNGNELDRKKIGVTIQPWMIISRYGSGEDDSLVFAKIHRSDPSRHLKS